MRSSFSILLLQIIPTIFAVSRRSPYIAFPPTPGPYPVKIHSNVELVDPHRLETLAPNGTAPQPRRIMTSVFQPLTHLQNCTQSVPQEYAPPAVAAIYDQFLGIPNGTIEQLQLNDCDVQPKPSNNNKTQLLLFSPGFTATRFAYSAELQVIASWGYTVISVDHTYEALAVQFPDGHIAYSTVSNTTVYDPFVSIRVADLEFVLESVKAYEVPGLQSSTVNTNRVGVFGHSMGGATAISALVNSTRFAAGANHDGTMYGDVLKLGTSAPVLLMEATGHNQTQDPSWYDVWQRLQGWGLQLEIQPSTHYLYSDLPLITKILGVSLAELLGEDPIDGARASELVWTYTVAFFDHVLKGKGEGLLSAPSTAFPEVVFENQTKYASV